MMRGLRVPDTSILIDGYRFRDVAAVQGDASGFLGDLLVLNSDRIEVMRGPGSALLPILLFHRFQQRELEGRLA